MIVAEKMAHDLRMPIVRLVDGTGGGGSVKTIEQKGYTLLPKVRVWPDVTRNLADRAGGRARAGLGGGSRRGARRGEPLPRDGARTRRSCSWPARRWSNAPGSKIGKNELGGSQIHTRNGVVDDEAASEVEAFERARRFLSYLPPSVYELPPRSDSDDAQPARREAARRRFRANPRAVYKIRAIVEALVDAGSFFEIGRHWGKAERNGLGAHRRLAGGGGGERPLPLRRRMGPADAREKVNRMVDLAQTLPPAGGAPGGHPRLSASASKPRPKA